MVGQVTWIRQPFENRTKCPLSNGETIFSHHQNSILRCLWYQPYETQTSFWTYLFGFLTTIQKPDQSGIRMFTVVVLNVQIKTNYAK